MPNTREKPIELIGKWDVVNKLIQLENNYQFYKEQWDADVLYRRICELEIGIGKTPGVTVQEWIPVSERLPEDDLPKNTKRRMIRCLVYTDKGTVKPCVRQRWEHFDGKMQPWMWNKDLYAKPTHWMPLPEPPKGE